MNKFQDFLQKLFGKAETPKPEQEPDTIPTHLLPVELPPDASEASTAPLSEEELEVYAGVYDPGRSPIRISLEDGVLSAMGAQLRPVGNHQFLPVGDDYRVITFTVEDGRAVSFRMEAEGHVMEAPRVQ